MSVTPAPPRSAASSAVPGRRRVRHQAQDVAAVMAFSLLASTGLAAVLVLLTAAAR